MSVADRLAALTPERRALLESRSRTGESGVLSISQERLWFLSRMAPGDPAYHVRAVMRLRGELDTALLGRCLQTVVDRHGSLRTAFASLAGRPVRITHPRVPLPTPVEDIAPDRLAERCRAEVRRPFALDAPPLVRSLILRTGPDEHVLVLTVHHIVCDGGSMAVLWAETARLYDAWRRDPETAGVLPEPDTTYDDFVRWERDRLRSGDADADLEYWRRHLHGAPARLDLPTDRPRPERQEHQGGLHPFTLDPDDARALRGLAKATDTTVYMSLLACYALVLAAYSGQRDLVVGSPAANRSLTRFEPVVGLFVNMLPMRLRLDPARTLRTHLERLREDCATALSHQDFPFDRLVDRLGTGRDLDAHPVFQAALAMQSAARTAVVLPGIDATRLDIDSRTAKFDLLLDVTERPEGIGGHWEYDAALFDPDTIAAVHRTLLGVVDAAARDPDASVGDLLAPAETDRTALLARRSADLKRRRRSRLRRLTEPTPPPSGQD